MIYLNRSFDVLTFKEDSGQIVYEILLILIVRSALASGKIRQNFKYLAIQKNSVLKLIDQDRNTGVFKKLLSIFRYVAVARS
jgi:hypothetical protein